MEDGPEKEKLGLRIETIIDYEMSKVYDIAVDAAKPDGDKEYHYFALSCYQACMREQRHKIDSLKTTYMKLPPSFENGMP